LTSGKWSVFYLYERTEWAEVDEAWTYEMSSLKRTFAHTWVDF